MTNRPPDGVDDPLPPTPTEPGETFEDAASNPEPADRPADDTQEA